MISTTSLQHVGALQSFGAVLLAVQQQKMDAFHSDFVSLNAEVLAAKLHILELTKNARAFLHGPGVRTSYVQDKPIHALISAATHLAKINIEVKVNAFEERHSDILLGANGNLLKAASLKHKREVLRSMPIVGAPVGAAFLGVKPNSFSYFKLQTQGLLGSRYMGSWCHSLDEIFMIAQKPSWLGGDEQSASEHFFPDDVLDYAVYVDDVVACAFTDLSPSELSQQVRRSIHPRRPYRLADLEKIRTGKLNTQRV